MATAVLLRGTAPVGMVGGLEVGRRPGAYSRYRYGQTLREYSFGPEEGLGGIVIAPRVAHLAPLRCRVSRVYHFPPDPVRDLAAPAEPSSNVTACAATHTPSGLSNPTGSQASRPIASVSRRGARGETRLVAGATASLCAVTSCSVSDVGGGAGNEHKHVGYIKWLAEHCDGKIERDRRPIQSKTLRELLDSRGEHNEDVRLDIRDIHCIRCHRP